MRGLVLQWGSIEGSVCAATQAVAESSLIVQPGSASRYNSGLMMDENGSLTILVPGTEWQRFGGWSPATNGLFAYGNGCTKLLEWSPSGNNDRDRIAGAQMLREMIAAHRFASNAKLNIIAHSHGGNVALAASHLGLACEIDCLIALSKPQIDAETYQPGENIRRFYNISTKGWDWIQHGGSRTAGHYKTDPRAVNRLFDTSRSKLKKHAALIWDDGVRETWWQWVLEQKS